MRVDRGQGEAHTETVSSTPPSQHRAVPLAAAPRTVATRMPPLSRERNALSAGALARRRMAVAVAKRALPVMALALLATVALWPEFDSAAERGRVAFRRVVEARPDALRIVAPRYQGIDTENRPYTLTATVAVQGGDESVVALEAPRADITMGDGAWIHVSADQGRFDRPQNMLDLEGAVTLNHEDGTQMVTATARLDLKAGAGEGDAAVAAQGPFGTLTADGFRLYDRGQVVVFTGRARTLLEAR